MDDAQPAVGTGVFCDSMQHDRASVEFDPTPAMTGTRLRAICTVSSVSR